MTSFSTKGDGQDRALPLRDRAGRPAAQAPTGLGDTATIASAEATKLPPEAIAAWVEYEPPTINSNNPLVIANGVLRHAFMSGFLAARRDTDGSPKGPDRNGLDGEAATVGAEGIANTPSESPQP